jgi:hypothetical protein
MGAFVDVFGVNLVLNILPAIVTRLANWRILAALKS